GPPIPDNAASGRVSATTVSTVDIDNRRLRLAPGARIYSLSNTTVTPNMVVPGSTVRYVFDERGQVRTIWIVDDGGGARRALPRQPGQRP
ncbi:MAG TPA: hypothetical protein VFR86_22150, partial [Burkholderiaceae bacterium]|nr:hypothetical protein [Burkholderiaceae bacterium]